MRKRGLALLTLSHLYVDMNQGLLPGLLPFLITGQSLSFQDAAGLIFAANILSSIIQPLFGHFADRFSAFYIMPLGILLSGLGLAAMGTVSSYWGLFISAAVSGIGIAAFHPEAARVTNQISGEKKGTGVSTFTAGGNIGIAMGPLVAIGVAVTWGIDGMVFLVIPAVVMAVLLTLQRDYLACFPQSTISKTDFLQTDEWGAFFCLGLIITFRSVIMFGINAFLPLYWMHVLKQPAVSGSSILTVIFVIGAGASLVAGRLADRFGHQRIIRIGFLALMPSMLLFPHIKGLFLATIMLAPIAICLFTVFSPMVVLGQKYLPNRMGLASGITLGLAVSIGGTTAPILGRIADQYGLEATFTVIGFLPLLALVAALALPVPRIDLAQMERNMSTDVQVVSNPT